MHKTVKKDQEPPEHIGLKLNENVESAIIYSLLHKTEGSQA